MSDRDDSIKPSSKAIWTVLFLAFALFMSAILKLNSWVIATFCVALILMIMAFWHLADTQKR